MIIIIIIIIILRVLWLEVSVYAVYISNQFQNLRGGGGKAALEVTVNSKEENSQDFCPK
jgi:hypothetical protein